MITKNVNKDLLKKQIEIALKVSNTAHYTCLILFIFLKFGLEFEGTLPFLFGGYFVISQINTLLFKIHKNVLVLSIVFFVASYLMTFLISQYSGGLNSPFLSIIVIIIVGGFISSLKHGRIFLCLGIVTFLILYLEDVYDVTFDYHYTNVQIRYFALLTYAFIFLISGYVGFIIAKTSFMAYKNKKELQEKNGEIEDQKKVLAQKNKNILDSIHYAKRIQTAMLPTPQFIEQYLPNSFLLYLPKDVVAGDFYWMEHLDGLTIFAVADCTGHGVPGAMISVVCNNALNRSVREFGLRDPAKILEQTRTIIIQEFEKSNENVQDGMDISLCVFNSKNMELQWAGANNPIWFIKQGSKEVEQIKADKQPVGKFVKTSPFTTHIFQLKKGDCFYIFSDGFSDQFGGEHEKKYMSSKFKKTLVDLIETPMKAQSSILKSEFENWKGDLEQIDDICIMGIKIP